MRLTLASASATPAATRWQAAEPTSSTDQPEGLHDCYEGQVQRLPGEDARAAFDRMRARLLQYDIFPPTLLTFTIFPPGEMGEGTLIVQRFGLGPVRLEFAVRVVEMWDRDTDAGFTYVTLEGHPERGTESFRVRLGLEGQLAVTIEAWSRPGHWFVSLVRPIARVIQRAMTRRALRRLTES
jgi:uncharacterized protein (UPF0548 family)